MSRAVCATALVSAVMAIGVGCGGLVKDTGGGSDGGDARDGANGKQPAGPVRKVDLLFDVQNSGSMGDLWGYLSIALPDMVTRLLQPRCMKGSTAVGLAMNGSCAAFPGSSIEFPPVHDMHVGVLSTSLGNRGPTGAGEVCNPGAMTPVFTNPSSPAIPLHNDDRGELVDRIPSTGLTAVPLSPLELETETSERDVGGQNFLDWFPTGPGWATNAGKTPASGPEALSPLAKPLGDAAELEVDFQAMVIGLHPFGCGIVSPLESWYRFLVQPDPYAAIDVVNGSSSNPSCAEATQCAEWKGVDTTIIKQRHDFLRPDSLVIVVDVGVKDDQEIDVRAFGGQAFQFMNQDFQPPRGTAACQTNPDSPACTSCNYPGHSSDPSCMMGPYDSDGWGYDINLRTIHMKQKYGLDAQFPIGRYVLGLTSPKVPDRSHEYPIGASCYQGGLYDSTCAPRTSVDESALNCTNPLFAASLPDGTDDSSATLCNASGAGGPRAPSDVFFVHLGGMPYELLQSLPGDSTGLCPMGTYPQNCPEKNDLVPADWASILGEGWVNVPNQPALENPNQYDYSGINPRMIESYEPRPGVNFDWVTTAPHRVPPVDLEYACIFPIVDPASGAPAPIDCTKPDFVTQNACDCSAMGLARNEVPPLCGLRNPAAPYAPGKNDYTTQYFAKAYPTIRQLELARLLGDQAVVGSLCPIHTAETSASDPLSGYRPTMSVLVSRVKGILGD